MEAAKNDAAAPADNVIDDSAVFLDGDKLIRVKTVAGEEHTIPPISFGRERRILKAIGSAIGDIWNSPLFQKTASDVAGGAGEQAQAALLGILFENAPEKLGAIAAEICGVGIDWVDEHLTFESVLELIVPFLKNKQSRIVAVLTRLGWNSGAAVAAVKMLSAAGQK